MAANQTKWTGRASAHEGTCSIAGPDKGDAHARAREATKTTPSRVRAPAQCRESVNVGQCFHRARRALEDRIYRGRTRAVAWAASVAAARQPGDQLAASTTRRHP